MSYVYSSSTFLQSYNRIDCKVNPNEHTKILDHAQARFVVVYSSFGFSKFFSSLTFGTDVALEFDKR